MANLEQYRASETERARTADLLRILPKGQASVLEIGARDGHFSRLLTEHFRQVTALDLEKPGFEFPGVVTVAGDVTQLNFPDASFDCVFCTEVLEHIPDLRQACVELMRVARRAIVIGVPYRQDTRIGRTTCPSCGRINPPWGHVNSFDENRLIKLFPGWRVASKSFVSVNRQRTNPLSTWLMDLGGNPWGTYDQDEHCSCGARLTAPKHRSFVRRCCSAAAVYLNRMQSPLTRPHGNWIHIVFAK